MRDTLRRLAVLLLLASAAACSPPPSGDEEARDGQTDGATGAAGGDTGGTLIVARTGDIDNLDPHLATAFQTYQTLELVYDTLFELDAELNVVPGLATDFAYSEGIGHNGFTGTDFLVDPERGLVVVLLTNRQHPAEPYASTAPVWRDVIAAAVGAVQS